MQLVKVYWGLSKGSRKNNVYFFLALTSVFIQYPSVSVHGCHKALSFFYQIPFGCVKMCSSHCVILKFVWDRVAHRFLLVLSFD